MSQADLRSVSQPEAFETHVREHQMGLRAFIRALGTSEAWVDDLAQEAFIIAYRRFGDFEPGTDFGRWLRTIARQLVANERRKEARHSRLLPAAVADVLAQLQPELPSRGPDLEEWVPWLRECVDRLPPRSRDLLQRRYAEGENAAALARELQMNASVLRQQLLRIRIAVKECLSRKGAGAWL